MSMQPWLISMDFPPQQWPTQMVVRVTSYSFISSSMCWCYSLSIPLVSQISNLEIRRQLKNTLLPLYKVIFAHQAWIQADANQYNGANEEVLWTTFANLGLRVSMVDYNDSNLLPSHFKPIVIFHGQTKLTPLIGMDICGVAPGWVVIVKVNLQMVITLFGVHLFVLLCWI